MGDTDKSKVMLGLYLSGAVLPRALMGNCGITHAKVRQGGAIGINK